MAETTRHGNYSIPKERDKWLKEQKQKTGLPESYYINKGLDVVIGKEKLNSLHLLSLPLLTLLIGILLFFYALSFSESLPVEVLTFLLIAGLIILLLSWVGIYRAIKIITKTKVKHEEKNNTTPLRDSP